MSAIYSTCPHCGLKRALSFFMAKVKGQDTLMRGCITCRARITSASNQQLSREVRK